MQYHAKTTQDLSEEQLQEITGGCAQCGPDLNTAVQHLTATIKHLGRAETYISRILYARDDQDRQALQILSEAHQDLANYHGQKSGEASLRILTRHPG